LYLANQQYRYKLLSNKDAHLRITVQLKFAHLFTKFPGQESAKDSKKVVYFSASLFVIMLFTSAGLVTALAMRGYL